MGLWVLGRVDLGLSEEEFWRSSPRAVQLLMDRKLELVEGEQMLDDLRFGKVLALIANIFARSKGSKAYQPSDFFTNLPDIKPREQTVEEQIAVMKANTTAMKVFG